MSKDNDMLCPWCGGDLSGKPGQYVKCRHCGSDIHWGDDGKPYKTRFQAAQPNPVVRDVPVRMRPAPTTPIQQTVDVAQQPFLLENESEVLNELSSYETIFFKKKAVDENRKLALQRKRKIFWIELTFYVLGLGCLIAVGIFIVSSYLQATTP